MRNKPSLDNLLDIVHEVIRDKILPELSGDIRYQALMVANAIGIVKRQAISIKEQNLDDRHMLINYSGSKNLNEFYIRLALEIRHGIHDRSSPTFVKVQEFLLDVSYANVAESNPSYIQTNSN